jgi:hypothetical protein
MPGSLEAIDAILSEVDGGRIGSLSGILCVRHSMMTERRSYAEQDEEGGCGREGGPAVDPEGTD